METVAVSTSCLFWRKLGKWQILTVILAMISILITSHFIGDKKIVGAITFGVVTIIPMFIMIIQKMDDPADFVLVALVAATAAIAIADITTAVIMAIFILLCIGITADSMENSYGIRNRVIYFSFAAESAIILLLMLLA